MNIWSTLSVWSLSIGDQQQLATGVCQCFIDLMETPEENGSEAIEDGQIVIIIFIISFFFP